MSTVGKVLVLADDAPGTKLKQVVYGTKQQELAMRKDTYLCMDERTEIW